MCVTRTFYVLVLFTLAWEYSLASVWQLVVLFQNRATVLTTYI